MGNEISKSHPIGIDCVSVAETPSVDVIAAMATSGNHVVLRFAAAVNRAEKAELIARLATALPEHTVFDSGGDQLTSWVTIMPVVERAKIIHCREDILRAIAEYRRTCSSLVDGFRCGTLSPEWDTDEHGGECRFENHVTGQVVEAPLPEQGGDPSHLDPYFFSIFVRTTPGLQAVASLITDDFHDAARILDVIEGCR